MDVASRKKTLASTNQPNLSIKGKGKKPCWNHNEVVATRKQTTESALPNTTTVLN